MKLLTQIVGIGVLGGFSLGWPLSSSADLTVSGSIQIRARADFDVPLAAHGSWAEIRTYGRCWRPTAVAVGWRPYCDGRWIWTDCGWYWESDEPWAWACYHYGRWVYDVELGWFWVPDVEWAPAWVYWRVGGGFIGWAPCPPRGVVLAPPQFSFVAVSRFHERVQPASVVINDVQIINQTKEITKIERANRTIDGTRRKVVINEGPGVGIVQEAVGREIRATPVQEVARHEPFSRKEVRDPIRPSDGPAPKPVNPDGARPGDQPAEPRGKPDVSEVVPPQDKSVRPVEPAKRAEPPVVKPNYPHESRGQRPSFDRHKSREHGKGRP